MSGAPGDGLGIGILGCGHHGLRYARHLAGGEVPGARLAALQRRDTTAGAEAAAGLGCTYHADPAALVSDDAVGAVIVASPPAAHAAEFAAVLAAGKPCLLEKPVGRTLEEAATMLRAAEAPGAPLTAVAYPLRWNAVVQEVRSRLEEIGPLRSLWLAMRQEAPDEPGWRDDPEIAGGGVALDLATHLIDVARWLTGAEFTSIRADVGRATESAVESHLQALGTMHGAAADGGAVRVQIEALRGTAGRSGRIEAVGTRGQLVGDFRTGRLGKVYAKADVALELPKLRPGLIELTSAFVQAAGGGERGELPTLRDGFMGNVVAAACYRAAATGTAVSPGAERSGC